MTDDDQRPPEPDAPCVRCDHDFDDHHPGGRTPTRPGYACQNFVADDRQRPGCTRPGCGHRADQHRRRSLQNPARVEDPCDAVGCRCSGYHATELPLVRRDCAEAEQYPGRPARIPPELVDALLPSAPDVFANYARLGCGHVMSEPRLVTERPEYLATRGCSCDHHIRKHRVNGCTVPGCECTGERLREVTEHPAAPGRESLARFRRELIDALGLASRPSDTALLLMATRAIRRDRHAT